MTPTLVHLETLARHAGAILLPYYSSRPGSGQTLQVEHKSLIDLVTDADRASEDYLLGEIRRRFPEHRIVSEESGTLTGQDRCQWIVDPLDGTINFAHGVPIFCISVAYLEEGALQLGAVYDPLRDELFTAQRGAGAWLNGEPLRVAMAASLDASLLVTGFPYNVRTTDRNNLDQYAHFALRSMGVRRLGSAALDLCYIAAGRFDGYWEMSLSLWDLAAGALIAREAGATVTQVDGSPDLLVPPHSILAANPAIHQKMLAELKKI